MTDPVSQPDRDAIRARVENATPGPWRVIHDSDMISTTDDCDGYIGGLWFAQDNEFIAHARADIPALLGALDAVEAERDALRGALDAIAECDRIKRDAERLGEPRGFVTHQHQEPQ